ncbi:hypothetical protein Vretifemale_11279 [Volvox reticuliferus]|uniref:Glyoxal or galactose oxidase n=1 Tax=Volvox reticuliferus TaxID=1737510 RepID=A0A8J4FMG3_9CHLO|nr:hypothetical protein Vretifemale_11279 [Volvox reticuliferus]
MASLVLALFASVYVTSSSFSSGAPFRPLAAAVDKRFAPIHSSGTGRTTSPGRAQLTVGRWTGRQFPAVNNKDRDNLEFTTSAVNAIKKAPNDGESNVTLVESALSVGGSRDRGRSLATTKHPPSSPTPVRPPPPPRRPQSPPPRRPQSPPRRPPSPLRSPPPPLVPSRPSRKPPSPRPPSKPSPPPPKPSPPPRMPPPSPPSPQPPSQPPQPPGPPASPPYNASADYEGPGPADGNPRSPGDDKAYLPTVPDNQPDVYGQWVLKALGNIVAIHMALIPGTDKFFFMERPSGRHPDRSNNIVGYYDYITNRFTNVKYTDSVFCAGHTVTQDGHVLVVGGHIAKTGYGDGLKGVRIFSRKTLTLHRIANMTFPRWYPTATLLPSGMVTIMGGTVLPGSGTGKNSIYEIWDPANPTSLIQRSQSAGLVAKTNDIYYPNTYVLPTGDLFVFCNDYGEILDPMTGTVRTTLPSWSNIAKGVFTEYPFTGTSVMLPLTPQNSYTPEVVYFGGQFSYGWINTTASRLALRIKVTYDPVANNYTFGGGWSAEKMPLPRVMGDAVLLPNGKVVVLNGAVKGLAGDGAAGGLAKANEPNLWPVLYDPYTPYGGRMRLMSRSRIPRLYHSTAALTTDGSVLVAGCDRCDKYWWTTPGGISKSPTSFAEYRIEVFRPPCWFNVTAKAQIESLDPETWDPEDKVNVMQYGQPFALKYSMFFATDSVTAAVLVSPGSATHSTNMNQRVVGLELLSQDIESRRLVVKGPPTINIAPPGWYMLFLLNGDVYGQSAWIRLPGNAPRVDSLLTPATSTTGEMQVKSR